MRTSRGVLQIPVFTVVLVLGLAAAPAQAAAAMSPEPAATPAAEDKPRPKRRAARRAPTPAPETVAAVPAAPVINPKYNDVMTAVMMRDHAGAAEILQAGAWVDRSDTHGETPLMLAAKQGDPKMTALLLQHGASPHRSGPAGNLHTYAAMGGNAEVVKMITKAGAR